MSSIIGRAAFRATSVLRDSGANSGQSAPSMWKRATFQDRRAGEDVLRKGAKRDPELYLIYAFTAGMFAWAGYRFAQAPTGSDYSHISKVPDSEPWKDESHGGKYVYYPDGDPKTSRKEAPKALNTTVIPNVTLPKSLHEQYNKFGKKEYDL